MTHVLQSVAWYLPQDVGGTEIYLEGLVEGLDSLGVSSTILVPVPAPISETYVHCGTQVSTYPRRGAAGDEAHFERFESLLRAYPGAIYHQHSWTPDCGGEHLERAHRLGHPTVLTVHIPANICLRGDMRIFGAGACSGKVVEGVCASCWAHGRGASQPVAEILSRLPYAIGDFVKKDKASHRSMTALRARTIARDRIDEIAAMAMAADKVVAVCQWLYEALALNGVSREKLVLSRQGAGREFLSSVSRTAAIPLRSRVCTPEAPLKLMFLGRWHVVKGIDTLVRAIRAGPDIDVELTIYGVGDGSEETAYRAKVEALIEDDPRIIVRPPLARGAIAAAMTGFDAMAAPANCLETGPLVVLEAQAAGLYILGSNLGGIAELVDSPEKGLLIPADDVAGWTKAIRDLANSRPRGVRHAVRTMDEAAQDMAKLYGLLN